MERPDPDGEIAVCHICDRRLDSQADLLEHLREEHEGDQLADDADAPR